MVRKISNDGLPVQVRAIDYLGGHLGIPFLILLAVMYGTYQLYRDSRADRAAFLDALRANTAQIETLARTVEAKCVAGAFSTCTGSKK